MEVQNEGRKCFGTSNPVLCREVFHKLYTAVLPLGRIYVEAGVATSSMQCVSECVQTVVQSWAIFAQTSTFGQFSMLVDN